MAITPTEIKLLTVKEASELINVKAKTLYQWIELEQIPHYRLNGSIRFDLEDLSAWIQSCKKDAREGYNICIQAGSPRKGGE